MKLVELKSYIGEEVEITFIDNKIVKGVLGYAEEFSEKYGWRRPNYFYINNISFKVSHIRKFKCKGGNTK